jgi:hypothetical protein
MSIVAAESVTGFFHEVVEDAMRARKVEATEGATRYLVCLLTDYAKPDTRAGATLDRPLAFLLDEALNTLDLAERFERLRTVGDGVLYGCGFFGDHFEARGLDQSYLVGIGVTAYRNAGSLLRPPASESPKLDVFGELAEKFGVFVEVLAEVADATVAMGVASSQSVVKLYERWLKTRSDRLADALASHGFVAPRGNKGIAQS